ncbi:GntR family transcriptional regulator [Flexivirga meconopsidis]|uniref:GntR family transcriptional regulator n=1 Tax=Flexivirga meconopsidis TaxID=2977121 RepID=UPI00223F474C|nr:GntR family transcriptional regulator [Flexivirga meconopsidis]
MFRIDDAADVPPYQQICDQVSAGIDSGRLAAGARLPSVRGLAAELHVAPGTVAKAYTQLEQAGLIETAGRSGTRVAASGGPMALAAQAAASFADRVRPLGLDDEQLVKLVRAALTS